MREQPGEKRNKRPISSVPLIKYLWDVLKLTLVCHLIVKGRTDVRMILQMLKYVDAMRDIAKALSYDDLRERCIKSSIRDDY